MTSRIVAVVPAFEESEAIGSVVSEIREFDAAIDVVVVDDGSGDGTAEAAVAAGAVVVRLPFNLGIGAAVQTGFRYALEQDYDVAVRLDGDGQHDATELPKLLEPLERGDADVVTGSRFRDEAGGYRPPLGRRLGITWFAKVVSLLSRQLRMLGRARQALDDGMSAEQAAAAAGAPPFKARELAKAAGRMDLPKLSRAFQVLCEADLTQKGGKCPPEAALEATILALTAN